MKKVFVITGGACGIGKCLVETFARQGNVVYFIDKDEARLQATERELTEQGLGAYSDMLETWPNKKCWKNSMRG